MEVMHLIVMTKRMCGQQRACEFLTVYSSKVCKLSGSLANVGDNRVHLSLVVIAQYRNHRGAVMQLQKIL